MIEKTGNDRMQVVTRYPFGNARNDWPSPGGMSPGIPPGDIVFHTQIVSVLANHLAIDDLCITKQEFIGADAQRLAAAGRDATHVNFA